MVPVVVVIVAGSGSSAPVASVSRKRASTSGVGWSKVSVTGRDRPVVLARRLRSSTADSESKPRCVNGRPGSICARSVWPSTWAMWSSTVSSTNRSRLRPGSRHVRTAPSVRCREVAGSRRNAASNGVRGSARSFRSAGMTSARPWAKAASHNASPASSVSAVMPCRAARSRSTEPPMPASRSHSPQASAMPAPPRARRFWITASTAALAAA